MNDMDRPNADLKPGDFFIVTQWCRARACMKPVAAHPMQNLIGCGGQMVACEEGEEGSVPNRSSLDKVFEVIAIDYPNLLAKMHDTASDNWSGKGYPLSLDCRDFECRRPSVDFVTAYLSIGAGAVPSVLRRPWYRRWLGRKA